MRLAKDEAAPYTETGIFSAGSTLMTVTPNTPTTDRPYRAGGVLSGRLEALLEDIAAGRAPNAGRFCGYCYNPLSPERESCPNCGRATAEWSPVEHIPQDVAEMHRKASSREGTVVRTIAWGGLTLGVTLALVPLAFGGVHWWTVGLFFGIMVFFYILSANLANSVGDALGYAWGQSILRNRWRRFVAERDGGADSGQRTADS